MAKSITPSQIKENNRQLILKYLYEHKDSSQQDITYALRLSRPTVTTKLSELEQEGIIAKSGVIDSELVGRKASAYSVVPNYRIAIGVEILQNEAKIIALDLYGEQIEHEVFEISFRNEEDYYDELCKRISDFVTKLNVTREQILGFGLAWQALISPDGQQVVYSRILDCEGLNVDKFANRLNHKCKFIHDAESAANAELWESLELQNAVYLSLSEHFGAAIISDRKILPGKHGHSGTIEHMRLFRNDKQCYCGRYGCVETACAINSLLNDDETLESFFSKVREGNMEYFNRWQKYLNDLALVIDLSHLMCDTDFILGGYLSQYITAEDIDGLYWHIKNTSSFKEANDFIYISKVSKHSIVRGAAIPFIKQFLTDSFDKF